jgi:hypothetical protein
MAGCAHFAESRLRQLVGAGIINPYRQYRNDLGFCVHPVAYAASGYKTGFISRMSRWQF